MANDMLKTADEVLFLPCARPMQALCIDLLIQWKICLLKQKILIHSPTKSWLITTLFFKTNTCYFLHSEDPRQPAGHELNQFDTKHLLNFHRRIAPTKYKQCFYYTGTGLSFTVMDCIHMRVWISCMHDLSGFLVKLRQKQLWLDYFKQMVPQVQMSYFNGTHLTKIWCEYLRYSLTPSEHVWCKSLCSLQHNQILRATHPNKTIISSSTWHFSSNKNASGVLQTQFLHLVKYTNNKKKYDKKIYTPFKIILHFS